MAFSRYISSIRQPVAVDRLVVNGRIDLRALMRQAIDLARTAFRPCGTWMNRMRLGLRRAWSFAKADLKTAALVAAQTARVTAARPVQTYERAPLNRPKIDNLRRPLMISGARAHSHSW